MKYTAWIEYPSMSIGVEKTDQGYRCVKFVDKEVVREATKICSSKDELKAFLLSIPNAPKEEINGLF